MTPTPTTETAAMLAFTLDLFAALVLVAAAAAAIEHHARRRGAAR